MDNNKIPKVVELGLTESYIKELLKQAMREAGFKEYKDIDGTIRPLNEDNA